jgi:hypothetical protein
MLCKERTKTSGVKDGPGSNNAFRRQSGDLPNHLGYNIDRVGDNQQNGIRRVLKDPGDDILKNVDITFQQLQARFSRFLSPSAGQNYQPCSLECRIIAGSYAYRFTKRCGKLGGTFRSVLLTDGILGREVFNFLLVALILLRFRRAVI